MADAIDKERESELVRKARSGDRDAFGALFAAYRDKVASIACRYVRDPEAALDIVQEAFLKAFKNIAEFKGDSLFYTWLTRIAINLAIDATRKRRDSRVIPFDNYVEGGEIRPMKAPTERNPGDAAVAGEFEAALKDAIEKLGEHHRKVFLLHAVEDMAYKDIAAALGISIGTVMSRLHYARKYLREMLKSHLDAMCETRNGKQS